MKNIRITLLIICMVVFGSQAIWSQQQGKTAEEKANERKVTMTKLYKLSDKQADEVYEAALSFWKKVEETKASDIAVPERRKVMKQAEEEYEAKLKNILTDEQYKKLLKVREDLKNKNASKQKKG